MKLIQIAKITCWVMARIADVSIRIYSNFGYTKKESGSQNSGEVEVSDIDAMRIVYPILWSSDTLYKVHF